MKAKIFFGITNNIVVNNVLIRLGLDGFFTSRFGMYKRIRLDENLSLREMAGFHENKGIKEQLDAMHEKLKDTVHQHLSPGDRILDIGCGPGTYLKDFENDYRVTGIDLNPQMIKKAAGHIKNAELIQQDFLKNDFHHKFNFIYSISVLEFIPPGQLRTFFRKVYHLLEKDGVILFMYPHALKLKDIFYPNLYYIEYSPRRVEAAISDLFDIISHRHAFDDREVDLYDTRPYQNGERLFTNGYLLIAKKKMKANI